MPFRRRWVYPFAFQTPTTRYSTFTRWVCSVAQCVAHSSGPVLQPLVPVLKSLLLDDALLGQGGLCQALARCNPVSACAAALTREGGFRRGTMSGMTVGAKDGISAFAHRNLQEQMTLSHGMQKDGVCCGLMWPVRCRGLVRSGALHWYVMRCSPVLSGTMCRVCCMLRAVDFHLGVGGGGGGGDGASELGKGVRRRAQLT